MVCSTPGLPVPHHLPEFAQVHIHGISDAIQPSHPLMPSFPSALNFLQHQGLFQWVICSRQMAKILELQLQHQSFYSEYSGLISLKIDRLGVLVVQGTFRSLLQHQSSRASILCHSAFFTVQLPQPYVTTGKIISLTIWTFVGRVVSLLFYTLSSFVNAFLPRCNCPRLSWLQSPSTVIWSPRRGNLSLLPHFPLLFTLK